ncbi:MAG: flagellar hook-basal body complex protein FliE [Planktotalea arctica]
MSSVPSVTSVTSITSLSATDAINRARDMTQRAAGVGIELRQGEPSFADRLKDSLGAVADAQSDAAQLVRDFETGKETDLTKVMVSQQVSSLGFQLTLNVRNKALSAYRDVMNMPV